MDNKKEYSIEKEETQLFKENLFNKNQQSQITEFEKDWECESDNVWNNI